MPLRLIVSPLLILALGTASAMGQMSATGAPEPDQPVRPQIPVLIQRPAQQSPAVQPAAPSAPFTLSPQQEAELDRVLSLWQQRNEKIKTFDCEFKRWTYDAIFGAADQPKSIDTGVIRYAAPDRGLFRVEKTEKEGHDIPIDDAHAEHWVSDGKSIFEYNHTKKLLKEHKLPAALQGKAIADSPLPFLFGADAKKLRQRYWMRIVTPEDVRDKIFLETYPRYQQDAANFYRAEFIIVSDGMAPYALNLVQPNRKDRIAYQFYNIVVNGGWRLFKGDPFRAALPFGWQKIIEESPTAEVRRPMQERPR
jgi:TIGR03009 family protein